MTTTTIDRPTPRGRWVFDPTADAAVPVAPLPPKAEPCPCGQPGCGWAPAPAPVEQPLRTGLYL